MNKSFESTVDVDSFFYGLTFNSIAIFKTITLNANVNLVFVERVIIFLKKCGFLLVYSSSKFVIYAIIIMLSKSK